MLFDRAPRGVLDAGQHEIRNRPPLKGSGMFDERFLLRRLTRVSRRWARVRPRGDFNKDFAIALLLCGVPPNAALFKGASREVQRKSPPMPENKKRTLAYVAPGGHQFRKLCEGAMPDSFTSIIKPRRPPTRASVMPCCRILKRASLEIHTQSILWAARRNGGRLRARESCCAHRCAPAGDRLHIRSDRSEQSRSSGRGAIVPSPRQSHRHLCDGTQMLSRST